MESFRHSQSSLSNFITSRTSPGPPCNGLKCPDVTPHSLEPTVSAPSPADPSPIYTGLALQVQHNLQHQQGWADLQLHTHSLLNPDTTLPRPLVSGQPPARLYLHPDQQAAEIAAQQARIPPALGRNDDRTAVDASMNQVNTAGRVEREWVLPTHLRETWTLRQFAAVFDSLGDVLPGWEGEPPSKRLLLAMLSDDSTVNYYIMHDGVVKPRQN